MVGTALSASDKKLIQALGQVSNANAREVIISNLDSGKRARLARQGQLFIRGRGKYKLPSKLGESLSEQLTPYEKEVVQFVERDPAQAGGQFGAFLLSALIPIISHLISGS